MATSDLLNQLHGRRTPDRVAIVHSLSQCSSRARVRPCRRRTGFRRTPDMQSFEYACRWRAT
jgi:hypothetical protein